MSISVEQLKCTQGVWRMRHLRAVPTVDLVRIYALMVMTDMLGTENQGLVLYGDWKEN